MVRNNNVIPNGHFHKCWQDHIKTWFNQPMRRKRRAMRRRAKINRKLPAPAELLRSMVNCPSVRYNTKVRAGRGFSLRELKAAGLNPKFAQTIGIAMDFRRRNVSMEGIQNNVQRLLEYRSKLIIFPLNKKKLENQSKDPIKTITTEINKFKIAAKKVKARVPTEEEKKFLAFKCLRKARADSKYAGIRLRRKKMKTENIEPPMKKVRLQPKDGD